MCQSSCHCDWSISTIEPRKDTAFLVSTVYTSKHYLVWLITCQDLVSPFIGLPSLLLEATSSSGACPELSVPPSGTFSKSQHFGRLTWQSVIPISFYQELLKQQYHSIFFHISYSSTFSSNTPFHQQLHYPPPTYILPLCVSSSEYILLWTTYLRWYISSPCTLR